MLWNDFAIKLIEIDFENTMIEEEIRNFINGIENVLIKARILYFGL